MQVKIVPSCGAAVVGGVGWRRLVDTIAHQKKRRSAINLGTQTLEYQRGSGEYQNHRQSPEECLRDGERESLLLSIFISLDLSAAALRQGPSNS